MHNDPNRSDWRWIEAFSPSFYPSGLTSGLQGGNETAQLSLPVRTVVWLRQFGEVGQPGFVD